MTTRSGRSPDRQWRATMGSVLCLWTLVISTASSSPQVRSSGGDVALTDGNVLTRQSVALREWRYYYIVVPSGQLKLTVVMSASSGDADLYVRPGSKPTASEWICHPPRSGSTEQCSHDYPVATTWWIGVYGAQAASFSLSATLVGTFRASGNAGVPFATVSTGSLSTVASVTGAYAVTLTEGSQRLVPTMTGCAFSPTALNVTGGPDVTGMNFTANCQVTPTDEALASGVTITGLSLAKAAWKYFYILAPPGSLTVSISGGSGDADLHTSRGSRPTTTRYDCRPYTSGSQETCTIASAQSAVHWIGVHGHTAVSGLSITAVRSR